MKPRSDYPPHWDAIGLNEVMAVDSGALGLTVKIATLVVIIITVIVTIAQSTQNSGEVPLGTTCGSETMRGLWYLSLVEWGLRHAGRQDRVKKVLWG